MYLLILGCNLWSLLLLAASAWLGLAGSPHHVKISLLAAVFSALVHGGGVALFLGGGKLLKEHVGRFNMPLSLIDRLNEVYHRLIPKAILGAAAMPVAGIIGGLSGTGVLPAWMHGTVAAAGCGYLLWLVPHEYRWLKRFHGLVQEVESRLPEKREEIEAMEPHPRYRPDEVVLDARGRGRALLYIGLSLPAPYLGYRFISGFAVDWLILPTILATTACLGAAVHYYRKARRAA